MIVKHGEGRMGHEGPLFINTFLFFDVKFPSFFMFLSSCSRLKFNFMVWNKLR